MVKTLSRTPLNSCIQKNRIFGYTGAQFKKRESSRNCEVGRRIDMRGKRRKRKKMRIVILRGNL
jgi:hypothetical protein